MLKKMKKFGFFLVMTLIFDSAWAQSNSVDQNPNSKLYTIDFARGQEILSNDKQAIFFKNALIELVNITSDGRKLKNMYPGPQVVIIKQIDPKILDGYQITVLAKSLNDSREVGWFYYDIKKNMIFLFDRDSARWKKIAFESDNIQYLKNCQASCILNYRDKTSSDDKIKELQDLVVNDN